MENKRQLIYVDDAKRAIEHYDPAFSYVIDNVPTVDAVEVVHGRWKKIPYHPYRCSECNEIAPLDQSGEFHYTSNYCPNCGAKMDGDIYE